jgi:hypothetical protein
VCFGTTPHLAQTLAACPPPAGLRQQTLAFSVALGSEEDDLDDLEVLEVSDELNNECDDECVVSL